MAWTEPTDQYKDFKLNREFWLKIFLPSLAGILILVAAIILFRYIQDTGTKITFKELDYGYKVKYLKIDDKTGEIAYIDVGRGIDTIVLIHGGNNYLKHYSPQIDYLKAKLRVIAIDLPGYGKSTFNPYVNYTLDFHVKAMAKFIKILSLKNVILFGHSYGAMAAMSLFYEPDIKIKKMILMSPAGLDKFTDIDVSIYMNNFDTFVGDENEFFHPNNFRKRQRELTYETNKLTDKFLDEFSALIRSGDYRKIQITRIRALRSFIPLLTNYYKKFIYISIPILVIGGKQDKVIPFKKIDARNAFQARETPGFSFTGLESPETFYKNLEMLNGDCKVKLIDNCGHLPNLEYPEIVNSLITEFLKH